MPHTQVGLGRLVIKRVRIDYVIGQTLVLQKADMWVQVPLLPDCPICFEALPVAILYIMKTGYLFESLYVFNFKH